MRGISGGLAGALAREQWRAQRRYTLTTGGLVALSIALAAFAVSSEATQAEVEDLVRDAFGYAEENIATVRGWTDGIGYLNGEPRDDWRTASPSEVAAIVDEAAGRGIDVHVRETVSVTLAEDADGAAFFEAVDPEVAAGQVYDGDVPGAGEVALSSAYAREIGVGVGDTVTVTSRARDGVPAAEPLPLTVSGLTLSYVIDGDNLGPGGLIAHESVRDVAMTGGFPMVNEAGERTGMYDITLTWDGAPLDGLEEVTFAIPYEDDHATFAGAVWLSVVGAGLLAIVAVGAALAAGRAQGEARTQWVATARALGATRRDIVAAGAAEGLLLGLVAGAIGIAAGWGIEALVYSQSAAAAPDAYGPSVAVMPPAYAAVLVGLAAVLALVIGLIPALWAARVAPSAALAPRRFTYREPTVPSLRLVTMLMVGAIGVTTLAESSLASEWGRWWSHAVLPVAIAVLAGLSLHVLIRLTRQAIPRVGARLERTRRPSLIIAGHGLRVSRASAAAATVGGLSGFLGGVLVARIADHALSWTGAFDELLMVWLGTAVLSLATGTVVGLAAWTTRGAALSEAVVTGALGLDRHGRQIAAMAAASAPILVGSLVGLAGGLLMGAVRAEAGAASAVLAIGTGAVGAVGVTVAASLGAAVASLFAARGVDAGSPQEAARLAR